jgi:hypothetical protein
MTIKNTYKCDGCGKDVPEVAAIQFMGVHSGQTTVASGGVHSWHSCSSRCAARHLREVADAVEKRGAVLDAEKSAYEADAAKPVSPG